MAKLSFAQYEQLKKQGLDDNQIQALADKYGYSMPKENILASAAETLLVKPAARVAEAVGRTGILGENIKRGYEEMSQAGESQTFNTPFGEVNVEAQKSFGAGGGRQIAADALESASYLAPIKGASWVGKTMSGAGAGYAADVSANLRDGAEGSEIFTPGLGTISGGIAPNIGPIFGAGKKMTQKTAKSLTARLTGLDPETVTVALTRPNELTKAQRAGLDRATVASRVETSFKKRLSDLSATGKGYQTLRQTGGSVDVPDNFVDNVLSEFGISVKNGKLVTTAESVPLRAGDIDDIEKFIAQYGSEKKLSANAFLNARQYLDSFKAFGETRSGVGVKVAAKLRKAFDDLGKTTIKGLKELDAKTAPEYEFTKKARKYMFDKDGNLTDTAINRIANAAGKGKDKLLERLEKINPGITQQIQLVKALEDIGRASGSKTGAYERAGAGALIGMATGGISVPAAIVGFLAGTPSVSVPIITTYARLNGFSDEVIAKVSKKLIDGSAFNQSELMLVRKAIINHLANLPSDKFDDEEEQVTETQNDNTAIPTNQ